MQIKSGGGRSDSSKEIKSQGTIKSTSRNYITNTTNARKVPRLDAKLIISSQE
jgi:hypothetical protein